MKVISQKNTEDRVQQKANRKININMFYPNFTYKNSRGESITPKNSILL